MGMTREEIKDELCRMLSDVVNGGYPKRNNTQRGRYREAVKETIKVLEQEEQEPCDAISRQAVEKITWEEPSYTDALNALTEVREKVRALPPVTPKLKTGQWITKIKSDLRGDMWPTNPKCSECGGEPYYYNTIYNYHFCPYCGARMVESEGAE